MKENWTINLPVAQFRDPDVEQRFRAWSRGWHMDRCRQFALGLIVVYACIVGNTYFYMGANSQFWGIFVAVSAACLSAILQFQLAKSSARPQWVSTLVNANIGALLVIYLLSSHMSENAPPSITGFSFVVLGIYILSPNTVLWNAGLAVTGSAFYAFDFLFTEHVGTSVEASAIAWLVLSNGFGFTICHNHNYLRRRDYTAVAKELSVVRQLEQSNDDLMQSRSSLTEKTNFLQAVLDNISQGVCVYDRNFKLAAWSKGFVDILKLPGDWPKVGRHIEELIRFNVERGEYGECNVEETVRQKMADVFDGDEVQPHHYERVRPDGTVVEVRGNAMPGGGIVTTYTDITERKRDEATIEQLALNDSLTGLANRNLFQRRLKDAIDVAKRLKRVIAVIFLDLDKFSAINDTHGHMVGDALLKVVGERLKECTRDVDTVARLGGDEFALILTQLQEVDLVRIPVDRILMAMQEPIEVEGLSLIVGVSIGISFFPKDALDADEIVRKADVSLFEAKAAGRGTYRLYDEEMDARVRQQRALENDLQHAIERNELELHYQPQLDIDGSTIVGAEALLRWHHDERGMVPPGEFIPIAEGSALIVTIGEWVLSEACRQAKAWQEEGLPCFPMAVNISPRQFATDNFIDLVAATLAKQDLDPQWLELEITEGMVMDNIELAVAKLGKLSELGLKLSIDDFGTGYSSLAYLKRFPVDKLKIDQSFVRDLTSNPEDATITEAVIHLGHSLNLKVIAEGVETTEHIEFLKSRGCDELQGYHFSKPLPAAKFAAWCRDFQTKITDAA